MPNGCRKIIWMVWLMASTLAWPHAANAQAVCGQMVGSSLICTDPSNPTTNGCYYNMLDTGSYNCATSCTAPKLLAFLAGTATNFTGRYCLSRCPAGLTAVTREPQPTCMTSTDYAAYDIKLKACANTVNTDAQQILTADTAADAKHYSGSCTPGTGHCVPITGPRFDAWKGAIDTARRARDALNANFPIGADGKIPLAQCDAHLSTLPTDLQAVLALYAAVPG